MRVLFGLVNHGWRRLCANLRAARFDLLIVHCAYFNGQNYLLSTWNAQLQIDPTAANKGTFANIASFHRARRVFPLGQLSRMLIAKIQFVTKITIAKVEDVTPFSLIGTLFHVSWLGLNFTSALHSVGLSNAFSLAQFSSERGLPLGVFFGLANHSWARLCAALRAVDFHAHLAYSLTSRQSQSDSLSSAERTAHPGQHQMVNGFAVFTARIQWNTNDLDHRTALAHAFSLAKFSSKRGLPLRKAA